MSRHGITHAGRGRLTGWLESEVVQTQGERTCGRIFSDGIRELPHVHRDVNLTRGCASVSPGRVRLGHGLKPPQRSKNPHVAARIPWVSLYMHARTQVAVVPTHRCRPSNSTHAHQLTRRPKPRTVSDRRGIINRVNELSHSFGGFDLLTQPQTNHRMWSCFVTVNTKNVTTACRINTRRSKPYMLKELRANA